MNKGRDRRLLPVLIAPVVASLALIGCGSGDSRDAESAPVESSSSTLVPEESTSSSPAPAATSDTAESDGLQLTVVSAVSRPSISYMGGNYNRTTPDGEAVTEQAQPGATYVYVQTTGINGTKDGIDLTCSFPVDARLVDSQGARYKPVEDLYLIEGNPGCNDNVNPGLPFNMTYVFLVPTNVTIEEFQFRAVSSTDFSDSPTATIPLAVEALPQ